MREPDRDAKMQRKFAAPPRAFLALGFAFVFVLAATAAPRIRLVPKLISGETFHYQVESTINASSKTTTPIIDPGAATQATQSISLLIRLQVLPADTASKNVQPGAVRLRATYESAKATSNADAIDPATPSPDESYHRLEGRSIEFTLEHGGAISDFNGLEEIFPNRAAAEPIISWSKGLSSGASAPQRGIEIGQKWNSERPFVGSPLAGLILHSDSTYLRNEPCDLASAARVAGTKSPPGSEECAVILTSFKILRHGGDRSDVTPPDYARNGLRTSGTWLGSGENLDSISLVSGLIVRSTQSSTEDVDYEITSVNSGSSVHQVSHTTTRSEIRMVPESQLIPKP